MGVLFTVLILIAAVLLILIVLVQNSKGGGLASNFQSSNQMLGVRKTTDFLEKATWVLSISIVLLSIATSMTINRVDTDAQGSQSRLDSRVGNWEEQTLPALPSPTATEEKK
ncbi:MAG: preprotein translocase subunit SecG [Bacteroidales bacterium]|nr:preprotein translocase subunit SecG [Bacteroidales bacterium]